MRFKIECPHCGEMVVMEEKEMLYGWLEPGRDDGWEEGIYVFLCPSCGTIHQVYESDVEETKELQKSLCEEDVNPCSML